MRPTDADRSAARRAQLPLSLTLVRHGQSARNAAKSGHRFFPTEASRAEVRGVADHRTALTDRGRWQAQLTGVALRRLAGTFDCAYTSGYERTEATLEGVLSAWSVPARRRIVVRHHLLLRERDSGYAYDMTSAEAAAAFPWLQSYWDTYGPIFARQPGGESLADVAARVHTFLQVLRREHPGGRVLIVTHGGTLWMFRMLLEGWTWDEAAANYSAGSMPQCGVTTYVFDRRTKSLALTDLNRVHYPVDAAGNTTAGGQG